jgi:acetylornithine deacetylase/succinyl-diaminopimelate desuccinylase-like protein
VSVEAALAYARTRRARAVDDLAALVRYPSVSAQPARAGDVRACATFLARRMERAGFTDVRLLETAGHPVVWCAWHGASRAPRLLVYAHYDVQPAEPLAGWRTDPFEPTIRGDALYGRGASDDKGQLLAHVEALEAHLRGAGRLPLNVTCLFEGEEEIGSPSLRAFLLAQRPRLAADTAVVSDTAILGPRRPALTYALRGGLGLELDVDGPAGDLHSGIFGGAVANPLEALASVLCSLHDDRGRVAVAGFYDDVREVSAAERAHLARVGPSDADMATAAHAPAIVGEPGFTAYERTTIRPSLSVNGVVGGYTGAGTKAIVPARAHAKLGCRLVADQRPERVEALLRRHLAAVVPHGVQVTLRRGMAARPVIIDHGHPAVQAAAVAYERGFGVPPVLLRSGGTVPVVGLLQELLGIPVVPMGFGLPDDGIHGPNERMHLPTFARAIESCIWFLAELGSGPPSRRRGQPALVGSAR